MTEALPTGSQTVLLPVPLAHVHEVAQFAAALAAGQIQPTVDSSAGPEAGVMVDGQGMWTPSMIDRLADSVTYTAVLALLDQCSASPGVWVAKADVEEAGGFSAIQLRNELGAFSKRTSKLFGSAIWPMEWKKERGTYSYRMSLTVAEWWTAARQGEGS